VGKTDINQVAWENSPKVTDQMFYQKGVHYKFEGKFSLKATNNGVPYITHKEM